MRLRIATSIKLKDKVVLEENHPKRRQSTIGTTEPLPTTELVSNKRLHFIDILEQHVCSNMLLITKIVHHPYTVGI